MSTVDQKALEDERLRQGWVRGDDGDWRRLRPKENWKREGIHIPPGFVAGLPFLLLALFPEHLNTLTLTIASILSAVSNLWFWRYQVSEDEKLKDGRYRDIAGYLYGWTAALVATMLVLVL